MKYLFSETGNKVLEAISYSESLFAFDFDGTLSPIVSRPDQAKMTLEIRKNLDLLSSLACVAIISGRSISDLKEKTLLSNAILIGNHGAEGLSTHSFFLDKTQADCEQWVRVLNKDFGLELNNFGIELENKKYSIALHYRNSRRKKEAKQYCYQLAAFLDPKPRVIPGKSVLNLVTAGAPHKGVALLEVMLAKELKNAFYIGDDDTDEDVFALPDSRIISVRVGLSRASQAKFYLKDQKEMLRLIQIIVEHQENKKRMIEKAGLNGAPKNF